MSIVCFLIGVANVAIAARSIIRINKGTHEMGEEILVLYCGAGGCVMAGFPLMHWICG